MARLYSFISFLIFVLAMPAIFLALDPDVSVVAAPVSHGTTWSLQYQEPYAPLMVNNAANEKAVSDAKSNSGNRHKNDRRSFEGRLHHDSLSHKDGAADTDEHASHLRLPRAVPKGGRVGRFAALRWGKATTGRLHPAQGDDNSKSDN